MEDNTIIEQENQNNQLENEQELSLMEKINGVFTSPTKTFESIAKFPTKSSDWIVPAILLMLASILTVFIMQINPALKEKIIDKQMTKFEKQLNKQVEEGTMTQEQADKQMEVVSNSLEKKGTFQMIVQIIGVIFGTFIIIFLVSGIFYLIVKFGMKGEGDYTRSLVAYSMPLVISSIQVLVVLIASLSLGNFLSSFSIGSLFGYDSSNFVGYLLKKIDPFSIWYFYVLGIAYGKLFKAKNVNNYIIMVFLVWIISFVAFYFIIKSIPFMASFNI